MSDLSEFSNPNFFDAEDPRFGRNLGFYSIEEQEAFHNSTVVVAGAGGDGGSIAEGLARLGVGKIRLADPEVFEPDNINRQAFSNTDTMGINKAIAVGNAIKKIRPDLKVEIFDEGINQRNIADFTEDADLIIDETEFTMHELGVVIARQARLMRRPVLMAMNVGFGAQVTSFGPKTKTFESFLGLSESANISEIAKTEVPLNRWLARVPSYADIDTFKKVARGEKSAPSVGSGVNIATGVAISQAAKHLSPSVNRGKPVFAPKVIYMDAENYKSGVTRTPRLSHYRTLAYMILRNSLNQNPKASY